MKKGKFMLIVGTAAWCATATFGSNPLPEDSMDAVRTMLRFAHANPRDTFTLDAVYVEPNFSMPEVFFGMVGIEGDWPVARRKAAFDAYQQRPDAPDMGDRAVHVDELHERASVHQTAGAEHDAHGMEKEKGNREVHSVRSCGR